MTKYKIVRPPLAEEFELPTREELLAIKPDDYVKLIFQVDKAEMPERIWVIVKKCEDMHEWVGTTDNDPTQEKIAAALPARTEVKFHPLDIIQLP